MCLYVYVFGEGNKGDILGKLVLEIGRYVRWRIERREWS